MYFGRDEGRWGEPGKYALPGPLRPSVLGDQTCIAGLRALCTATRATERERVWQGILPGSAASL